MMRDVIEHIHNQDKFFGFLKNFMSEKSLILCIPPWQNPFGGHQQHVSRKFVIIAFLSSFAKVIV